MSTNACRIYLLLVLLITPFLGFSQEEDVVFITVEEMPVFPGCEEESTRNEKDQCTASEIIKFVVTNVTYPEKSRLEGVGGTVFVKFVISETGVVESVALLRSVNDELDAAAIAVIEKLPTFIPGRQKGKAVKVSYAIPVKFSIRESDAVLKDLLQVKEEKDTSTEKSRVDEIMQENRTIYTEPKEEFSEVGVPFWPECTGKPDFTQANCMTDAITAYAQRQVVYPPKALKKKISGTVEVTFDVDSAGVVTNMHVSQPIHPLLDAEALRVMGNLPQFQIPEEGPVVESIRYMIPVRFELLAE